MVIFLTCALLIFFGKIDEDFLVCGILFGLMEVIILDLWVILAMLS